MCDVQPSSKKGEARKQGKYGWWWSSTYRDRIQRFLAFCLEEELGPQRVMNAFVDALYDGKIDVSLFDKCKATRTTQIDQKTYIESKPAFELLNYFMTYKDIGKAIGVSSSHARMIMKGEQPMKKDLYEKIMALYEGVKNEYRHMLEV